MAKRELLSMTSMPQPEEISLFARKASSPESTSYLFHIRSPLPFLHKKGGARMERKRTSVSPKGEKPNFLSLETRGANYL